MTFADYVSRMDEQTPVTTPTNMGPGMGQTVAQTQQGAGQQKSGGIYPGLDSLINAGGLVGNIFTALKNKQSATKMIQQAMALKDAERRRVPNAEIFDVDDELWDTVGGILNQKAKDEITVKVSGEIQRMMTAPQTINPTALRGMANRLAMDYIKARVKTLK